MPWGSETYEVVFDGKFYESTMTGDDEGSWLPVDLDDGSKIEIYTSLDIRSGALPLTGSHTIEVRYKQTVVHAMDSKYFPIPVVYGTGERSIVLNSESNIASGSYSNAEGYETQASGYCSHAEGYGTNASGYYSHVEGDGTNASGNCSHAEGNGTNANKYSSHAEGYMTKANGEYSHAEGENTISNGAWQHVGGKFNIEESINYLEKKQILTSVKFIGSQPNVYFSDGYIFDNYTGLFTLVPVNIDEVRQHKVNNISTLKGLKYVIYGGISGTAMYSNEDNIAQEPVRISSTRVETNMGTVYHKSAAIAEYGGLYARIIGNGTSNTKRSNAHTLDWNGVGWFAGGLQVGGIGQDGEGVGYVPAVPAGVQPGQVLAVKTVDANGKPIEWEVLELSRSTATDEQIAQTVENYMAEHGSDSSQNANCLPEYSEADNGKVLGIVNGTPAWVTTVW